MLSDQSEPCAPIESLAAPATDSNRRGADDPGHPMSGRRAALRDLALARQSLELFDGPAEDLGRAGLVPRTGQRLSVLVPPRWAAAWACAHPPHPYNVLCRAYETRVHAPSRRRDRNE